MTRIRLGVNVDHVATVRNARGGQHPDPLKAAEVAIAAGADSITIHLREDRRHIRDGDVQSIRHTITRPTNLEMAATQDMLTIALETKPHAVCLVPERREERTTEGGLDAAGQHNHLKPIVAALNAAGIRVSLFVAADSRQIAAAKSLAAPVIELHTGAWCEALADGHSAEADVEFARLAAAVREANALGIEVHAGHGLTYDSAETIAGIPGIAELNIGHFMMGEALFDGLPVVVAKMREAIDRGQARGRA